MDTLVLVKVEDHIEGSDASVDNEAHVSRVESRVHVQLLVLHSLSISVWAELFWVVH